MAAEILELGAFRAHILLPGDVVGSIISDRPTWHGLTEEGGLYRRHNRPVLSVAKHDQRPGEYKVVVLALEDVWLQEPGLSVKVGRVDGATWRGFGPTGRWTSEPETLRHVGPDGRPQAYRSTVHFPRGPHHPRYTVGVEYRSTINDQRFIDHRSSRFRLRSDGGFTKLLDNVPPAAVPWQGCQVFGEGYPLTGTKPNTSERPLRRWELAGHQTFDWMHFLGWTGGAGAVVNSAGRTPPPGKDITVADGYSLLWDPRAWRKLGKGQTISQTIRLRTL